MDATSFLGLQLITHNPDKTVTLTQPKLLQKLFTLYPPRNSLPGTRTPYHPYALEPKDLDPTPQPMDTYAYLRLLDIILYLTKSRSDIMAAVSFADTKSSKPTDKDFRRRRIPPPPHKTTRPYPTTQYTATASAIL